LAVLSDPLLKPTELIRWPTVMMGHSQDLNRAIRFAVKFRERKPPESNAANIRFALNRVVVWGLANPLQDRFKFGEVGLAKS
jgi:hypothetical protein